MTATRFWTGTLVLSACTAAGAWTLDDRPRALATLSVAELEDTYLECDRLASADRMPADLLALCAAVAQLLLERRFDGDFERQLTWWRGARRSAPPLLPRESTRD